VTNRDRNDMTRHAHGPRPLLRVDLLGQLEVRTARDVPIHLGGRHAPALFALLVLTRRPRSREAVAADLWPDADSTSAGSLRQALWLVRHGLAGAGIDPDAILEVRQESIGIRPEARLDVDAATFERCLDEETCGAESAVTMYRGDLLEALGHDCFAAERERLADRFEDALVIVAQRRLADGDLGGARRAAQRVLARDLLREEAHAILMECHGAVGARSQVVRQYRRLQAVLARELGETPLPETDAVYRQALRRSVSRSLERAAVVDPDRRPILVAIGT
jgi:DNA-binding SARP family transcriptional activator